MHHLRKGNSTFLHGIFFFFRFLHQNTQNDDYFSLKSVCYLSNVLMPQDVRRKIFNSKTVGAGGQRKGEKGITQLENHSKEGKALIFAATAETATADRRLYV